MIKHLAAAFGLLLSSASLAEDSNRADSVAAVVFEAELLADISPPATIYYRYDMSGRGIEPPFESQAKMILSPGERNRPKN